MWRGNARRDRQRVTADSIAADSLLAPVPLLRVRPARPSLRALPALPRCVIAPLPLCTPVPPFVVVCSRPSSSLCARARPYLRAPSRPSALVYARTAVLLLDADLAVAVTAVGGHATHLFRDRLPLAALLHHQAGQRWWWCRAAVHRPFVVSRALTARARWPGGTHASRRSSSSGENGPR